MRRHHRKPPSGLTLLELLMVLAVVGLLAGLVLPSAQPTVHEQLRSAARILAADMAYARSLAVSNGSRYRIVFEPSLNRYALEHSGTATPLDTLPDSPFRKPGDPPNRHITRFDELPRAGAGVRLLGAAARSGSYEKVSTVEFGPLGATTHAGPTVVWLAAGAASETRYITVTVNPVTGLAGVDSIAVVGPPLSLGP